MDNRSAGSHGSLYPDLRGETRSLDAPDALEVFAKGRVTGGRPRRSRAHSPGPIGLQIDPTKMETFEGDNYCVGLYLDDGDAEQGMLPAGAGGHASTGSIDNSQNDSNELVNLFDDSYLDNKSTGSIYGEIDLNDDDLKPAASLRKNNRSSNTAWQSLQDADSRSEEGSRSTRSARSVHTNPGVLLNDKAQRSRKSAPKQTTASERLAQFGATMTRVRSGGSVHSAGKLYARPTQPAEASLPLSANALGGARGYPSQMDNCGFDEYTSPKNGVWGPTGNVGTTKTSKPSSSPMPDHSIPGMYKEATTMPLFNECKSMTTPRLPVHHRETTTMDSRNFVSHAGTGILSARPLTTASTNSPFDQNSQSAYVPSANARIGVETMQSVPRVTGFPSSTQKPAGVPHVNPYLKATPKPLETHRATPYVQSVGNKQAPLSGSQGRMQQQEFHIANKSHQVGDANLYNTGSPFGLVPCAAVETIARMDPLPIPTSTYGNSSSFGRPRSSAISERIPSAQVVVPPLGQNEHDKFQNAFKNLKTRPVTSQVPPQSSGTQIAGFKPPPIDAGVPFGHHAMEPHRPAQLPHLDHTTGPSVKERYPSNHQKPMSPMKQENMPTSSWGRSPLAGTVSVSKKGHSIIDNGTNNRFPTHGPLDAFLPPPPPSPKKKNKMKNTGTKDSDGTKPKKVSSFGSLGALVGGIRRGKHK